MIVLATARHSESIIVARVCRWCLLWVVNVPPAKSAVDATRRYRLLTTVRGVDFVSCVCGDFNQTSHRHVAGVRYQTSTGLATVQQFSVLVTKKFTL